MFGLFKKKKADPGFESEITVKYVPGFLPTYGYALDAFVAPGYRVSDPSYIAGFYKECDDKLADIIDTTDQFTLGTVCDNHIKGQKGHVLADFEEDVAHNERQCRKIRAAHTVRKQHLEKRNERLDGEITHLREKIQPLKDLVPQYEVKIGKLSFSLAVPVTIAAMLIDALLNYSYLQGILLQSQFLLIICVLCLSIMSDGSMYFLGKLLSLRNEQFMSKRLYKIAVAIFIAMFALSVIASIMIRFGSMDVTYGSIDATGQFVAKESYSLAEIGVSLVTAFLTTATGIISLIVSVDENAHLVKRCREMTKELAVKEKEQNEVQNELCALENADDPAVLDRGRRKAAERDMQALFEGLPLHMRKLLILHQKDPAYTDAISESAANVFQNEQDVNEKKQNEKKMTSESGEAAVLPFSMKTGMPGDEYTSDSLS